MSKKPRFSFAPRIAAGLALLAAGGCAPPVPYVQPSALTPQNSAALEDSHIPAQMMPDTIWGDQRLVPEISIAPAVIDGGKVQPSTTTPHYCLVTPGPHHVEFVVAYVNVPPHAPPQFGNYGIIKLSLNFVPGKAYAVMSTQPQIIFGGFVRSNIWIEDSAGNPVTKQIGMTLAYSY